MRGTKERECIQERIARPWGVLGKEGIVLAERKMPQMAAAHDH